jgi:hypothetical protein
VAVKGAISALVKSLEERADKATAVYVLAELSKHGKVHLEFIGI